MRQLILIAASCIVFFIHQNAQSQQLPIAELQKQVVDTERAFAKTMADRDHSAFTFFLSSDAIFFSRTKTLHGKAEIAQAWKALYQKKEAPFSWSPEQVEVLGSGNLALSTGPVLDPSGKMVGTFTSIWRLEAEGVWRIVFDKGNDVCDCAKP